MSTLTESHVKSIIRDEVRDLKNELEKTRSTINNLEQRMGEIHAIQTDVHKILPDVQQLVSIVKNMPDERRSLGRILSGLEDIRARLQTVEKSVAYASAYAVERLKERADRGI